MFSFKRKIEELQVRRAERENAKALEKAFGESLRELQSIFASGPGDLQKRQLPDYPRVTYLGRDYRVHASAQVHHIESHQFPAFLNLVREGRRETSHLHFVREHGELSLHTILGRVPKLSGLDVRLLSNDVALIDALAQKRFNPPAPWIALYEFGPVLHVNQGDENYWLNYVWDPFWRSLTLDEQTAFVAVAREETAAYISDADWAIWVESVRMRDARYRVLEE